MYVPKLFRVEQSDEIVRFMQNHPFAILVNQQGDKPVATHIPLEVVAEGDALKLTGHLAYGNPQWRTFEASPSVLVIFQGPHSYISPSWYGHANVPTWNYTAIHAYGTIRIITGDELRESLKMMLNHYEQGRPDGRVWSNLPADLLEREIQGIVGFEIVVTELQAAYKLSQNRNDEDFTSVVRHLDESADAMDHDISTMMRQQRPNLFEE